MNAVFRGKFIPLSVFIVNEERPPPPSHKEGVVLGNILKKLGKWNEHKDSGEIILIEVKAEIHGIKAKVC